MTIIEARGWWARLRGLAWRRSPPAGVALLLRRCRSVHTFGMCWALDLVWLDRAGAIVRVDRGVPPRRLRTCLRARSVIEVPAGGADAVVAACGQADAVVASCDHGGGSRAPPRGVSRRWPAPPPRSARPPARR